MNAFQKITDYFRSARAEMTKVSWPSREQTIRYSALVIGISVVVAVFFASLDLGLTKAVDLGLAYRAKLQSAPAPSASSTPGVNVSTTPSTVTPTLDLSNLETTTTK